jgi:hypothetical protein
MKSRLGRTVLTVIGVVAVILGAVWIGQGANLIPGSFMTGDRTWFAIGLFVAAAGVGLLVFGLRRPRGDG